MAQVTISRVDAMLDEADEDHDAITAGLIALCALRGWSYGDTEDSIDGEWHADVIESSGAVWAVWTSPERDDHRRCASRAEAVAQVHAWMPGGAG